MSFPRLDEPVTPRRIMQFASGFWASAVLAASTEHRVFTHLAGGPMTPGQLSEAAGISARGAAALLDGLTGMGLVTVSDRAYSNAPDAAAFLVEGQPAYFGGFARMAAGGMPEWANLGEVVRRGGPEATVTDVAENPFWEHLVRAILPMGLPVAHRAAARLDAVGEGHRVLDIGGGGGPYGIAWLSACPAARVTQLDWPNVNKIAREILTERGLIERFSTIDGDFHTTDFGGPYDVVILSNIAHQETPESNREIFGRVRAALADGGTFVVSEFVVDDDRSGPEFSLLFAANMLMHTPAGGTYTASQYREWLSAAGFGSVEIEPTPSPSTLIYAR